MQSKYITLIDHIMDANLMVAEDLTTVDSMGK
jgi:hypothetical protein